MSFMSNIIAKGIMCTWHIEKIVEIDTVAAGSHTERKREIDYTQIVALWMMLCPHHLPISRPKSKTLTYWTRNKLYSTTDS
jgi:hypothetical protein